MGTTLVKPGWRPHITEALSRVVTQWCNRLLGVVQDRSFHGEGEAQQYASDQTGRDYLWNVISMGCWGVVFPLLTIVVTWLSGTELAGMFSMAFIVANLLMILANFGIRTFQVSDVEETYSFADYRINRLITCVLAVLVGAAYCSLRGYDDQMATIVMGMVVYKAFDGLGDVYEGRLQQMGKMYLGGVSLTVRSAVSFVAFVLVLLVTGSLPIASIAMAVIAGAATLLVSMPLAHLETEKSRRVSFAHVIALFRQSWPLFAALFMYSLIDNMPKFVMEGMLTYDNQLYYNALYFPAMFVLMTAQTVYKPMLVTMANVWRDPEKRRRFDLIILAVVAGIVVLSLVMGAFMLWIGVDILGFLYGLDFRQFQDICVIMVVSGGVTAGIDFLYQVVTILRRQHDVIPAYIITILLSLFTPMLLITYAGLYGAAISYLISMTVLFGLIVWVYARIRLERPGVRHTEPASPVEKPAPRHAGQVQSAVTPSPRHANQVQSAATPNSRHASQVQSATKSNPRHGSVQGEAGDDTAHQAFNGIEE